MLQISPEEYRGRLEGLRTGVKQAGLDLFIVSALDSIYYLTGAGFEPLERPFFLLIRGWKPFSRIKGWLVHRTLRLARKPVRSSRCN